jgi:membrane-associated protease RseP (regulator of RpoE activity)
MTLQVKPMPARRLQGVALDQLARVTLNASQQSRYWIGVELGAPEETLRSQLKLAPDQGVVVVNVVDDGPAAKAGTKKHDVFLSFSDNPIASAEDVRVKLQEIGEKPIAVKLLREGKPLLIEVTPEKHQEPALAEYTLSLTQPEVRQPLTVEVVRPALVAHSYRAFTDQALFLGTRVQPPAPADPQTRIQELVEEMKQLQKKLEALGEEIKKQRESAPASGK